MAKQKIESLFTTEIKHSVHEMGGFFHKIQDLPHMDSLTGIRFDLAKPFDAFGVLSGVQFAVEIKAAREFSAFGVRHLRPNQVEGLDRYLNAGGLPYVFLVVKHGTDKTVGRSNLNGFFYFFWPEFKAKRVYTKAELLTRQFIQVTRVKVPNAKVYNNRQKTIRRYNMVPFEVDLLLREHRKWN
jgi:hypothetical protein